MPKRSRRAQRRLAAKAKVYKKAFAAGPAHFLLSRDQAQPSAFPSASDMLLRGSERPPWTNILYQPAQVHGVSWCKDIWRVLALVSK